MKIIVALDSFKGTLSARAACEIVRDGLRTVRPDIQVVLKPMADGGEGTAEALLAASNGIWIPEMTMGPMPDQRVEAGYAWMESNRLAVVEMAVASGITLLKKEELNPLLTTTFGTGELIRAALEQKPDRILLAVGGSATVDGGMGAARALGWEFLDANGKPVGHGGRELERISSIRSPVQPFSIPVEVLCDVDNPLCGEHGAARVFGPQKGATPEMVERLDRGLEHFARCIREQVGVDVKDVPGAGAAGGLAAGAIAFMGAKLVPGIDTVMQASGLYDEIADADWVISGEGRFDSQSLRGKVVSGIVRAAKGTRAKVAVMAGSVQVPEAEIHAWGVETAMATERKGDSLEVSLSRAPEALAETSERFAGRYL